MNSPFVLGIDIGGSHITTALVDIEKRALVPQSIRRSLIDSQASANTILGAWSHLIADVLRNTTNPNQQIGIAMPGPFDYENGISLIKAQDKFRSLYQYNIKKELAGRLSISTENFHFINDAAAFLQGEVFVDGAIGANKVLGFTLGTGLGSAICINGLARDAALWDAPFLEGMAEDYLSSKWFVFRYHQLTGKQIDGVKELAALVQSDENARQVFKEFGNNFAQFLMPLIESHKAEVIILGGNIAQAFSIFEPYLSEVLVRSEFTTKVKVSALNEHAALIGAASCYILTI